MFYRFCAGFHDDFTRFGGKSSIEIIGEKDKDYTLTDLQRGNVEPLLISYVSIDYVMNIQSSNFFYPFYDKKLLICCDEVLKI